MATSMFKTLDTVDISIVVNLPPTLCFIQFHLLITSESDGDTLQ